ncbi:MAG: hypothetical protein HQK76_18400 [Desulfobacterales bacterium]|nr:hypothetical protein [Desulfobacterales bacterium]
MYAIEFRAKIKNGIIEIPEIYKNKLKDSVKVIILTNEKSEFSSDTIEELVRSPIKLPNFKPLRRDEIYDRG